MRYFTSIPLIISILFIIPVCETSQRRQNRGLMITNTSSAMVRITELKKITFTDTSTRPWMREYRVYVNEENTIYVKPGEIRQVVIEDGYYGIMICDGRFCAYTNFTIAGKIHLMLENVPGRRSINRYFLE